MKKAKTDVIDLLFGALISGHFICAQPIIDGKVVHIVILNYNLSSIFECQQLRYDHAKVLPRKSYVDMWHFEVERYLHMAQN